MASSHPDGRRCLRACAEGLKCYNGTFTVECLKWSGAVGKAPGMDHCRMNTDSGEISTPANATFLVDCPAGSVCITERLSPASTGRLHSRKVLEASQGYPDYNGTVE